MARRPLGVLVQLDKSRQRGRDRIFVRQNTNSCDWRAVKLLLDMLHETEGGSEPEAAESSFSEADQKVIEQLKARLNGKKRGSDD